MVLRVMHVAVDRFVSTLPIGATVQIEYAWCSPTAQNKKTNQKKDAAKGKTKIEQGDRTYWRLAYRHG